jgi:hypothetical protein
MDPETPGHRSWIIDTCVPWAVVISCSIYDNPSVNITMVVTGQVSYVYHFRSRLVDVGIFHIIYRGFRRQLIHLVRSLDTHFPRTGRLVRCKPDSIINTVINIVNDQHGFVRIYGIGHIGAFDLLKLRVAVIKYLYLGFLPVNGSRLRNGLLQ